MIHEYTAVACWQRGEERKKNPMLSKRKHLALLCPKIWYLLVLGHRMSDRQRLTMKRKLYHYTGYVRCKIETGSLHQHQRHFSIMPHKNCLLINRVKIRLKKKYIYIYSNGQKIFKGMKTENSLYYCHSNNYHHSCPIKSKLLYCWLGLPAECLSMQIWFSFLP